MIARRPVPSSARTVNAIALGLLRATVAAVLLLLVWAIVYLIAHGWSELTRPAFYTSPPNIAAAGSGVGPQLFNTVYELVLSMLLTVPLGLAAGTWFAEYSDDFSLGRGPRARRMGRAVVGWARRATETLATLPSIVVGLFAYSLFVVGTHTHPSRWAAALALTIINLPYAVRVTEETFRSLEPALREGSLALGATRWQTITRTLFPAALPQLVTGIVLVSGRVFGEAAAVLFAGGGNAITQSANYSLDPTLAGDTLAVNLYVFRTTVGDSVPDAATYADGVAGLLIILVLGFNLGARFAGRVVVRRVQGLRP